MAIVRRKSAVKTGKQGIKPNAAPEYYAETPTANTNAPAEQHDYHRQASTQSANYSKPWTYTRRGYAFAQGLRQLRSRKFSSLITLLVFGLTLALPALILFTASSLAELGSKTVGEESITAYLTLDTADLDGAALAQKLDTQAGIRSARYVSRDEALAIFYAQSDIGDAVDVLGENPLPGAIILYPDADSLNDDAMTQLSVRIKQLDAVENVQFDLRWVQRLQAVLNLARTIGWIVAGFLTLTALLVIGNTIRLELLRRQNELDVSRLLGASNAFLNRPLLYTGALYGFLGGIIACGIALLALNWLQGPAAQLSSLYSSAFELIMPTTSQLLLVVGIATLLGIVGALVTLYQPSQQFLQNGRKSA